MLSMQSVKSFNNHIPVVVYSFFEFGIVSKWSIRDRVETLLFSKTYGKF